MYRFLIFTVEKAPINPGFSNGNDSLLAFSEWLFNTALPHALGFLRGTNILLQFVFWSLFLNILYRLAKKFFGIGGNGQ